ncbi:MAG: DUF2141 domain-containing protein [Flavisolibacter sp.]|nr:DUF2141 domain-containing protein [Flavisolibacter sp.]MBD0351567.1 DUF2141 domain-containing protein [Flavisolibacter sp.]
MLKFFLNILFLLNSCFCSAQNKIVAVIQNLRNDKGSCKVCLFNDAASFNGKKGSAFQCQSVAILNRKAEAVFVKIPSGTYAISVFHDANNNNKLDFNFLGIPKEGYGASKNQLPFASAPSFEENKFTISSDAVISLTIRLRHLY